MITEIAWTVQRYPYNPFVPLQGIDYRRADVTGSEFLTVKAEDGEWRWDVYSIREHDKLGRPKRLAGSSRPTLKAAKAAALAAWNELSKS